MILTHMRGVVDLINISIATSKINSGCCLEKEFTKLIYMNPVIIFYIIVNQVTSC